MICTRSWATLAAVCALFALVSAPGFGQIFQAQPKFGGLQPGVPVSPALPPKGGARDAAALSSIKIVEESKYRQVINVARDCIKDKDWTQAVKALQAILDQQGDNYVQVRETDSSGRVTLRWTSVKFEANNLFGTMPVDGLEAYEVAYGARAKDVLDEAKKKGDRELLAEVAQRYCHTQAGIEANELLATLFLARGQHFMAALRFEKLLAMPAEHAKLSDVTLYKAALAFHRVGDGTRAAETWKRLEPRLRDAGGLNVGERLIPLTQLHAVLHEGAQTELVNLHDWLMVRGNVSNTAQANGSPPLLDKDDWRRPLLNAPALDGRDQEKESEKRVAQAIEQLHKLGQPVLPGFFPVATQGRLLYRSYGQINSVFIKKTRDSLGDHEPGELEWRSMQLGGSLPALLETPANRSNPYREKVEAWLTQYANASGFSSLLFENSTIGTLSCDHKCVYAIDDLAVPPPGSASNPYMINMQPQAASDMKPLVMRNNLVAYKIVGGKIDWDTMDEPEFADSHFLGVPIAVGGKLYALNEKNPQSGSLIGDAELRLVCIDTSKRGADNRPTILKPIQMLGLVQQQDRVTNDPSRRINAVHLAYGEGILVCPTNAGEVFGVDLMTRSLVWSYPYREQPRTAVPFGPIPGIAGNPVVFPGRGMMQQPGGGATLVYWKSAPPAIADGKVVFTAPDANSVHCIQLRDGTPVWKKKQNEGDLYLAGVYQGRVLVVGKNVIRAYNLKDGTEAWKLTTGDLPSGQGVASKNIYFLPLQKGEILAIDIEKGAVKAHNRAVDGKMAPGNLVFYDGAVLSETPNEIVAYPQLASRLELARQDALAEPASLDKRTAFGELLLKDGQVQGAVEELLHVTARNPPSALAQRARDRLFEALTDLMQLDFAGANRRYLDEFKTLALAPDDAQERQQRLAKFYRIVGQGREAQGDLVEAFRMYKDFGALPLHSEQGGVASADDPGHEIPTHVWLRGRISAMIDRATPEQREPLEQKIAAEWRAVNAKNDIDAIRSFVGMFDVPFKVGREARLRLAEAIMERNDRGAFLEAELYLQQLLGEPYRHDPTTAGRSLAALALLEEKKGTIDSMKLAASYYQVLAREFPKARVRQDKTGEDLLNELGTDKRYFPFLEETAPGWGQGPIKVRELSPDPTATNTQSGFVLTPEGDQTPFARRHRLLIDRGSVPFNPTVRLIDVATGRERWSEPLTLGNHGQGNQQIVNYLYPQQQQFGTGYHANARFRFFQVKGHLLVFQVGAVIYCVDGDKGKKLWEQATVEGLNQPNLMPMPVPQADPENPEFFLWNQLTNQKPRVALGQVGAVQASYVAILTHKGLFVNDPLRGTALWSRALDSPGARVFGDEQHIYLVEGQEGSTIGRVLRATDGETLNVPDFGAIYSNRIRQLGRRILAAVPTKDGLTLKLYDIVAGKDVWSKAFPPGTVVAQTEERDLAGVIDPKGQLSAFDVETGRQLLSASLLQGRNITAEELKNLKDPLLLQDRDHYYVALNHPVESKKVAGGVLHSNFSNGLRCAPVNGWFLALHRQAGQKVVAGQVRKHAQGEMAWDSFEPILNQMIVLEQFEHLPVLIFSCRYNEQINGGVMGSRWMSDTRSFDRRSGSLLYPLTAGVKQGSMLPQFVSFQVDQRAGTITLNAGTLGAIQLYLDDGRAPVRQEGRLAQPIVEERVLTGIRPPIPNGLNGRILIRQQIPLKIVPAPPPPVKR